MPNDKKCSGYVLPTDLPDITPKQLNYCMGILQGKTKLQSYKDAYNCTNMSDAASSVNASRLHRSAKVALYLDQAKQLGMARGVYTLETYIDDMHRLSARAEKSGNYGAACNCLVSAAKAAGLMIERHLSATVDAKKLETQWQDLLNQRMRQTDSESESVTESVH